MSNLPQKRDVIGNPREQQTARRKYSKKIIVSLPEHWFWDLKDRATKSEIPLTELVRRALSEVYDLK